MNLQFKTEYRVIPDMYCGFQADFRPWWSPFWFQINGVNTSRTLAGAKQYIEIHKKRGIYYESVDSH